MKAHSLYSEREHQWIILGRDPDRNANIADTNHVVLISDDTVTLIDPGGIEVFPAFFSALTSLISLDKVERIILTSPDPDALSSLPLWRKVCSDKLEIHAPSLWKDLVGHLDCECEIKPIGDDGTTLSLPNDKILKIIPAHYLHAPATFSVYDPIAKVLYSSSIGSALNTANSTGEFVVANFKGHVSFMEDYHRRWFGSERARDDWFTRIADIQIDHIIPHRGPAYSDTAAQNFLDWFKHATIGSVLLPSSETPASSSPLETAAEDDLSAAPIDDKVGPPVGKSEPGAKYRLVTRSDFDGLVSAVILEQLDMIDDIMFVHPNDMQEGNIDITENDITTNLPYVPGCYLSFDHHISEISRLGKKYDNHIIRPEAPSAARIVYEYYGGKECLPNISTELMEAVDQADSAQYTMQEVLHPERWSLINFIMDSRTGLGRFQGFRIPNYELMMSLIEYCQNHSIEEILEIEDVKERALFYKEQAELFADQVTRCGTVHGNLVVLDLMDEQTIFVGNRFLVYALFPETNISMHVMWGRNKQNVTFSVGKSIFDKSSNTNVGELMLKYGGGGHQSTGACKAETVLAETTKSALIQQIIEDG